MEKIIIADNTVTRFRNIKSFLIDECGYDVQQRILFDIYETGGNKVVEVDIENKHIRIYEIAKFTHVNLKPILRLIISGFSCDLPTYTSEEAYAVLNIKNSTTVHIDQSDNGESHLIDFGNQIVIRAELIHDGSDRYLVMRNSKNIQWFMSKTELDKFGTAS